MLIEVFSEMREDSEPDLSIREGNLKGDKEASAVESGKVPYSMVSSASTGFAPDAAFRSNGDSTNKRRSLNASAAVE